MRRQGVGIAPESATRIPGVFFQFDQLGVIGIAAVYPGEAQIDHLCVHVGFIVCINDADQATVWIFILNEDGDGASGDQVGESPLRFAAKSLTAFGRIDSEESDLFLVADGRLDCDRIAVGDANDLADEFIVRKPRCIAAARG